MIIERIFAFKCNFRLHVASEMQHEEHIMNELSHIIKTIVKRKNSLRDNINVVKATILLHFMFIHLIIVNMLSATSHHHNYFCKIEIIITLAKKYYQTSAFVQTFIIILPFF